MDPITIVLTVGGILVAGCIVGIVRNWNKSNDPAMGPQVHLTLIGWLLGLFAIGVAVTFIILAWQDGWFPTGSMGRLRQQGTVAICFIVGLLSFFIPACILHMLGIRAWHSDSPNSGEVDQPKPKHKQLRYRLGEEQPDDHGRP